MKVSRSVQKAEGKMWKAVFLSIPLTMKVFLRGRIGRETIAPYMFFIAPIYTWLFFTAFEGDKWVRMPTFHFDLWGANIMTIKELIIYAMPLLCLFHWFSLGRAELGHERGESLFWGSMEGEKLTMPLMRQWLDPLLPLILASSFYFLDLRLFFFFAIGGMALFIEESVANNKETRGQEIQKANVGRERRRRGLDPKGKLVSNGEARLVQLVLHKDQPEYNQQ
ncbi:MAG: hypothetical protein AAFQ68_24915 [Bacteroidota bacterium]